MDRTDRVFEAMTAGMKDWADVATGRAEPQLPPLPPRWQIVALELLECVGGFLLYLLGLGAVLFLLGAAAAAARLGWESIG